MAARWGSEKCCRTRPKLPAPSPTSGPPRRGTGGTGRDWEMLGSESMDRRKGLGGNWVAMEGRRMGDGALKDWKNTERGLWD